MSHDAVLRGVLLGAGVVAFGCNVGYWLACRRLIRNYTRAYQANVAAEQNLHYLGTVQRIQAVCLVLWAFLLGAVLVSRFVPFDIYTLADRNMDLIWLVFSTIPYFLGYVAIHQPEIFKVALPRAVAAPAPQRVAPEVAPGTPLRHPALRRCSAARPAPPPKPPGRPSRSRPSWRPCRKACAATCSSTSPTPTPA